MCLLAHSLWTLSSMHQPIQTDAIRLISEANRMRGFVGAFYVFFPFSWGRIEEFDLIFLQQQAMPTCLWGSMPICVIFMCRLSFLLMLRSNLRCYHFRLTSFCCCFFFFFSFNNLPFDDDEEKRTETNQWTNNKCTEQCGLKCIAQ